MIRVGPARSNVVLARLRPVTVGSGMHSALIPHKCVYV